MKKLIALCALALYMPALHAHQHDTLIKHENDVITIEKGPTEVWFLHTAWYERVGPPGKEQFRDYSTREDSLVRIVHKEATMPLTVAERTYKIGKPQRYGYSSYAMAEDRSRLGLECMITRNYRRAVYDEKSSTITSRLLTESFLTSADAVFALSFALIFMISLTVFKLGKKWHTDWRMRHAFTLVFLIVVPLFVSLVPGKTEDLPEVSGTTAFLYTGESFMRLMAIPLIFLVVCACVEGYFIVFPIPKKLKRIENIITEQVPYLKWTIIALIYYAWILHKYTNSWLSVLAWFAIAFATRIAIRLPSRFWKAAVRNWKNSTPVMLE